MHALSVAARGEEDRISVLRLFLRVSGFVFSFKKYFVLEADLSSPLSIAPEVPGLVVRKADLSDLAAMGNVITPRVLEEFKNFLEQGKVCLVGMLGGRLAAYSWLSFEQRSFIRLGDKQAYFFGSYVLPAYRNKGIHTSMTLERMRLAAGVGFRQAIALVETGNMPALRALGRLGFRKTAGARELTLGHSFLRFSSVDRNNGGQADRDRELTSRHKWLSHYLFAAHEICLSFLPRQKKEEFMARWQSVPSQEFECLRRHVFLDKIRKVVVVGAGALPYTAVFFARKLGCPVFGLEESPFCCLAALRSLHSLNAKGCDVRVVRLSGENYTDYRDALVIINLQVRRKNMVLQQVLKYGNASTSMVIRQPLPYYAAYFDKASFEALADFKHEAVGLKNNFESFIFTTRRP